MRGPKASTRALVARRRLKGLQIARPLQPLIGVAPVTIVVRHLTQTFRAARRTMKGKATESTPSPPLGGAMSNSTSEAHQLKLHKPPPRVSETSHARRQALSWVADQLRWERTLDALRERSTRRPVRS